MHNLVQRLISTARDDGLRYLLVGGTTAVLCWGSLILLVEKCGMYYLLAANISTAAALLYSYLMNKYVVFRNRERRHVAHGTKFLLLQLILWMLANALLFVGVDIFSIHYFVMVLVVAVTTTTLNYFGLKFHVFKTTTLPRNAD